MLAAVSNVKEHAEVKHGMATTWPTYDQTVPDGPGCGVREHDPACLCDIHIPWAPPAQTYTRLIYGSTAEQALKDQGFNRPTTLMIAEQILALVDAVEPMRPKLQAVAEIVAKPQPDLPIWSKTGPVRSMGQGDLRVASQWRQALREAIGKVSLEVAAAALRTNPQQLVQDAWDMTQQEYDTIVAKGATTSIKTLQKELGWDDRKVSAVCRALFPERPALVGISLEDLPRDVADGAMQMYLGGMKPEDIAERLETPLREIQRALLLGFTTKGQPIPATARELGIAESTARRWAETNRSGKYDDLAPKWAEMKRSGMPIRRIAKNYNVSPQTVYTYLQKVPA